MRSLRELYRIGLGPSSSHTIGPHRAAKTFLSQHNNAHSFRVTLYGSLAATGRGHRTDVAIERTLHPKSVEIVWKAEARLPEHPNGMHWEAVAENGETLGEWQTYSIGGGALSDDAVSGSEEPTYHERSLSEVLAFCESNERQLWQYVMEREDEQFSEFLDTIWQAMHRCIERGIHAEGTLPGGLGVQRRAKQLCAGSSDKSSIHDRSLLAGYAYAVSEENANGEEVVTAPTCGGAGVLPAVLRYAIKTKCSDQEGILRALATAGLIGNLIKHNASISGAEVGCQGEVGAACAMAAAAVAQILGGNIHQVEYAAEMGLEHHLGLTCDPVRGLVQVPCIERNAHAAMRAWDCGQMAVQTSGEHLVSFDEVVQVMLEVGRAMPTTLRETAGGGLAQLDRFRHSEND